MKNMTGRRALTFGKPVLNITLMAAALFVSFIGVFDGVQANAQTAAQVAQIVKSSASIRRRWSSGWARSTGFRRKNGGFTRATWPMANRRIWMTHRGQLVKPRMEAPQDAVWFRRWIEVPANFAGLRPDGRADLVQHSSRRQWPDAGDYLLQRAARGLGR